MSTWDKVRSFAESRENDSTTCLGVSYGDLRSLARIDDQLRAELAAAQQSERSSRDEADGLAADLSRAEEDLAAAQRTITQLREDAVRVNLRMDEAVWIIVEAGVYTDAHWKSRRAAFLASGSSTGDAAKCYQCANPANDTCPLCGRSVCGTCAEREGESCCDTEVPPGWTKTEFDASLERLLDRPITWTDVCAECGADNRTNRGKPCVKCGEPRATEPAAPELAPAMQKPCPHRTTIIACPGIISGDGFCNKCGAKDFGEKPAAPASAQGTMELILESLRERIASYKSLADELQDDRDKHADCLDELVAKYDALDKRVTVLREEFDKHTHWTPEETAKAKQLAEGYRDIFPDAAPSQPAPGERHAFILDGRTLYREWNQQSCAATGCGGQPRSAAVHGVPSK